MRFVRYGRPGEERPALLDSDGQLRSVAPLIADWTARTLAPECLSALAAVDPAKLPRIHTEVRLTTPLADFRQISAVGLNYRDHAREAGMAEPSLPLLFHKALSSICGPFDDIVLPLGSVKTDWEVELGVIIGRTARNVAAADALSYVAGYCLTMDVSEREWQFERGGLLNKGKSADSFTPVGPWIVSADELPDPQSLRIWLDLNDRRQQDGHTREMIFSVAAIIEHITQYQTLLPGELVLTGTPAGVGFGMKPQQYLRVGDRIHCGIDGLGEQRHRIAAHGL
jgi:2,4-didehydro-3-deoxy-L-rhamnonate hydrolase